MHNLNSLLALTTSVAASMLALAAPTSEVSNDVPPINGMITMCPKPAWGGDCQTLSWANVTCYIVPAPFNSVVQSAAPLTKYSPGACVFYHEEHCVGDHTPGIKWAHDNFEASGMYSPFRSWMCGCGQDCKVLNPEVIESIGQME